jgi:hypothetical protein
LAVKTRARVRTLAQWVNHVKTAEAVALHNVMRQLLRQVSVQHSLKNQETRARRVTHAHQQVALATARCAEVVKTRVAIGRLRVVPTASHVMVPLVLRLVHLVTAMRVRHVMTVLLVVISDLIVRLVHSVTAMRVRHVMTVLHVVTSVQTVQLVMTVRLAHLMATVLLVVTLVRVMTARLVLSTAILVRLVVTLVQTAQLVLLVPTVMVAAQTA